MQRCNVATLEKMLYLCPENLLPGQENIFPSAGKYFSLGREYFSQAKRILLRGQEITSSRPREYFSVRM